LAAEAGESQIVAACSTCFNVLRRTNRALQKDPAALEKMNYFLERPTPYAGQVEVRHLLDVLVNDAGLQGIAARARPGLGGLPVAAYYGCMLLRPEDEIGLDDPERPQLMDRLLAALGAAPVDYPHRAECCGGYLAVKSARAAAELSQRILGAACRAGAQVVATACPLCQFNLDRAQGASSGGLLGFAPIPVLYFTQLMGLAFGLEPAGYGFDTHRVDPRPLLQRVGVLRAQASVEGGPR
jgi:heterodisulfide reductase subunit B2